MKRVMCGVAMLALSGCVSPPTVTDYNGASVRIQVDGLGNQKELRPQADAEAFRICRAGGKKRAEIASVTPNTQTYTISVLYLCLD